MVDRPVKVRIAPSPTGDPHVGTAYIALFNYAFAKQRGGSFVLRIEDTDQARSRRESETAILEALRWLGIQWDEGPDVGGPAGSYRQSERLPLYRAHVEQLVNSGHAYWCACTAERLTRVRQEQSAKKQNPMYDGHCRDRDPAAVRAEIAAGAPGVVRLRVDRSAGARTTFTDLLRGSIVIEHTEIDDQVLLKSDGFPTYHLACVVDDHLMEITHVLRGEEWISSTPKHVLLYQAFGWQPPALAHLPLLRNADKSKVSKRKNPVSLDWFRAAGYLPDALLNFLGMMAFTFEDGREIFSLSDFVQHFSLERVSLGGPVFDLKKLLWLNGRYLREQRGDDDVVAYLQDQLFSTPYLKKIVGVTKERFEKSEDFVRYGPYFFAGDVDWTGWELKGERAAEAVPRAASLLVRGDRALTRTLFLELAERFDGQLNWSAAPLEEMLKAFCIDKGLKPKELFSAVRFCATGRTATPGLFETLAVLGRERCRTRVRQAVAFLAPETSDMHFTRLVPAPSTTPTSAPSP